MYQVQPYGDYWVVVKIAARRQRIIKVCNTREQAEAEVYYLKLPKG
jgi:hypothetical protein